MATITFEDGTQVIFDGIPTQKDVDEVAESLKLSKKPEVKTETGKKGFEGIVAGTGKGLVSTASNILDITQKIGQKALGAVLPGISSADVRQSGNIDVVDNTTESGKRFKQVLAPEGGAEKLGYGVEKIAEFAIPGKAITTGAKALQATTAARTGSRVAGLASRVGTEAVGNATIAGVQTNDKKEALDAALVSALFPVGGAAYRQTRKLTANQAKEFAPRIVNSLIKPLAKDLSYGKNPGRAVAEEGIIASNFDELGQKIGERLNATGDQIGLLLSSPAAQSKRLDLTKAMSPIDEAIKEAQKSPRTNSALIKRLEDAKADLLGIVEEDGVVRQTKNLVDVTPLEATGFKREVGNITKFTGNASDDKLVNQSLKRVYGNLMGAIGDAVPGVRPLNERFADLMSAKIATEYRDKILERQNLVNFNTKVAGATGAIIGAIASGGAALPAIIAGMGLGAFEKALSTPKAKTSMAAWLAKSTPAQRKALFDKAPWAKAIILKLNANE